MDPIVKPRIAIVGDLMVDVDLHCTCERICQEGPWPVMKIMMEERRPGGASNVAQMCSALGCETLLLGLNVSEKRRVIVDGKLTGPRIDSDSNQVTNAKQIFNWACSLNTFQPEVIIVADHGKGAITDEVMEFLAKLNIPLFVDPVKTTPFAQGCWAGGSHELSDEAYGSAEVLIEKRGPHGLAYRIPPEHGTPAKAGVFASAAESVSDTLGAGDQFISVLAWMRCLGFAWSESIETANIAAGMQCGRRGCVPVTRQEIEQAMSWSNSAEAVLQ